MYPLAQINRHCVWLGVVLKRGVTDGPQVVHAMFVAALQVWVMEEYVFHILLVGLPVQSILRVANSHELVQPESGTPLLLPRSHSSPASVMPFPQLGVYSHTLPVQV